MINLRNLLTKIEKLDKKAVKLEKDHKETLTSIEHILQEIHEIQLLINESGLTLPPPVPKQLTIADYRKKIGRPVKILNPKFGEPDQGNIEKVGRVYVTVKLPNGSFKKRIPKNIVLLNDEYSILYQRR